MIKDHLGDHIIGSEALDVRDFKYDANSKTVRLNEVSVPSRVEHLIRRLHEIAYDVIEDDSTKTVTLEFQLPLPPTGYKDVIFNVYVKDKNNNIFYFNIGNFSTIAFTNLQLGTAPISNLTNGGNVCYEPVYGFDYNSAGEAVDLKVEFNTSGSGVKKETYKLGGLITTIKL